MDAFDLVEPKKRGAPMKTSDIILNVLTVVVLLTTLCLMAIFLLIFIDPQSPLNPLPPMNAPTEPLPTVMLMPSATATRVGGTLPPTWTATIPATLTSTPTSRPTSTTAPTATPFVPVETTITTPQATVTPGGMSFVVMQGYPLAQSGLTFHPEAGCNWMGVAGQAVDLRQSPITGLYVQLGGSLDGKMLETLLSITGVAPQYGQGFFEFTLSDHVIASKGTLWVQLFDQASLPLSDKIYFDTFNDCNKNLIIIYFKQVK